jgi:hypothetical protein
MEGTIFNLVADAIKITTQKGEVKREFMFYMELGHVK